MEEINPNLVYKTLEVARLLQVSVSTILRYARCGKIRTKKLGGKFNRYLGSDVLDFMRRDT